MIKDPETLEDIISDLKMKQSKANYDLGKSKMTDPGSGSLYGLIARAALLDYVIPKLEYLNENGKTLEEQQKQKKEEELKPQKTSILKLIYIGAVLFILWEWLHPFVFCAFISAVITWFILSRRRQKKMYEQYKKEMEKKSPEVSESEQKKANELEQKKQKIAKMMKGTGIEKKKRFWRR